ncbi:MAG TPA: hypothetical protein VKX17_26660 [Planctomycetota bacterium]|nr:hypothetical protein [Planctomycetota bacterium]
MRIFLPLLLSALLVCECIRGEDADQLRETGIAALKDSETNPHSIVLAARCFAKAAVLYSAAKNETQNVEMNSFLYWCKKKMSLKDIEEFRNAGEAEIAEKLTSVEKTVPAPADVQKWLERADSFAAAHPDEHLLIAIRYFEVADRFKGTDQSFTAQDRSLKEQVAAQNNAGARLVPPTKDTNAPVPDGKTQPIPSADKQKEAEKLLKELFKADFAKSDPASRLLLHAKMMQQAQENKADPASEYILLREARDAAILAGDPAAAVRAYAAMKADFTLNFDALYMDFERLETVREAPAQAPHWPRWTLKFPRN